MRRSRTKFESALRPRRALLLEELEPRLMLDVSPTAYEQYLLELTNRARFDPAAEAALFGIDLNEGLAPGTISPDPKQPLAFNPLLNQAALGHSQWMIDHNVFSHTGEGGSSPGQRMEAAGYVFAPSPTGWGENLAWTGTTGELDWTASVEDNHRNLFLSVSHRQTMLDGNFTEAGVGIVFGEFVDGGTAFNAAMGTEKFAFVGGDAFLTGVAFDDSVLADGFYTPGEGLGGVEVMAVRQSDGAAFTVTTWDSGGYALALEPGVYDVIASGGALGAGVGYFDVSVGAQNMKLDFTPDMPPVALPPSIALDGLPPDAAFEPGDAVEISWTATDPHGSATIDLFWDADGDPDNNTPANEGTAWGRIASALPFEGGEGSYLWTVDAPVGGPYRLLAVIDNGAAAHDYAEGEFWVGSSLLHVAASHGDGASFDFGELVANAESQAFALTFTSAGTAPVAFGPAGLTDPANYSLHWDGDGAAPESLAPGEVRTLFATFAPVGEGEFPAELTVPNNSASGDVHVGFSGAGIASPYLADVHIVLRYALSEADVAARLPEGMGPTFKGGTFFAEVWARNMDGSGAGIVAGSVDIVYESERLDVVSLSASALFGQNPTGGDNPDIGLVDNLGGETAAGVFHAGVGAWARLAVVEFAVLEAGDSVVRTEDGFRELERAGEGAVPWENVGHVPGGVPLFASASMFDITGDGVIGQADFDILMAAWGSRPGDPNWNPRLDFDGNGRIGVGDYAFFTAAWQKPADDPDIVYPLPPPANSGGVGSASGVLGASSLAPEATAWRFASLSSMRSFQRTDVRPSPWRASWRRSLELLSRRESGAESVLPGLMLRMGGESDVSDKSD